MGVLLHWTQANSFEFVVRQSHGCPQERQNRGESWRGDWGDRRDIRKNEFINLKVVKAYLRSSIQQEHLNSLAIMSIESEFRRGQTNCRETLLMLKILANAFSVS